MLIKKILLLLFCFPVIALLQATSQPQPAPKPPSPSERTALSPTIASLKQQVAMGNLKAVEEFWKEVEMNGAPIIEPSKDMPGYSILTFVYRGNPGLQSVRLDSSLNALLIKGIEPDFERLGFMERLIETTVWYLSFHVRNDLRTTYSFYPTYATDAAGGTQARKEVGPQLDPYNHNVFARGVEREEISAIELPKAVPQPWVKEKAGVSKGKWDTLKFNSKALGNERTIWVYKPAGYEPKRNKPYGFVVCFGGFEFGKVIPTDVIIDNLIAARKIPLTLAILIDNVDAKGEQDRYSSTIQFVADELIPHLRKQYNLTREATQVAIAGTSRRGLVAALAGYKRPDVFGGILSMSGSLFWRPDEDSEYEWLAAQFAAMPSIPLRLYLVAGLLETVVTPRNMGHYMLSVNRHMRNVLQAKGYKFKYEEFNGGHEDLNWQGAFANGLIYLMRRE